jgi:hypothetical protein
MHLRLRTASLCRSPRTGTSVDLHGIAFGGDRGIQKVELISTRKRAGRKRRSWILQRRFHGVSGIAAGCHLRPVSTRSQCVRPMEPVRCRSQKIAGRFRKAPPVPQKTVSSSIVEIRMVYLPFEGRFRLTAEVLAECLIHSNRRDRWS